VKRLLNLFSYQLVAVGIDIVQLVYYLMPLILKLKVREDVSVSLLHHVIVNKLKILVVVGRKHVVLRAGTLL
jgi:hypothetical protein